MIALDKAPSQSDIVCSGENEKGRPRWSAKIVSIASVMTSRNLAVRSAVKPALCEMARKSGWNDCHASEWPAMPRMNSLREHLQNGERYNGSHWQLGSGCKQLGRIEQRTYPKRPVHREVIS